MLFEVATPQGASTHAGVLEFTAPEGVVLLPEKVANCLWGLPTPAADALSSSSSRQQPDASTSGSSSTSAVQQRCCGQVVVTYKRLEKGTFVRFQPAARAFHEQVGADTDLLKEVLEQALLCCCTLTEGDWIQVRGWLRAHVPPAATAGGRKLQNALPANSWGRRLQDPAAAVCIR
jgi:ubiquitin fusion degradation protein 1